MAAPLQNLNKTLTLCLHVCLLFWRAGFGSRRYYLEWNIIWRLCVSVVVEPIVNDRPSPSGIEKIGGQLVLAPNIFPSAGMR